MEKQLIISIGREFGSGGHEIAVILSQRFGLPLYEENLLKHIADERSLNVDRLQRYDESPKNIFMSRSVHGFSNAPEEHVAQMQFQYLRARAQAGESFVVVGRCAEEVLKDYPGLVSVFVRADIPFKKARIMQHGDTPEDEALELLARKDRRRKYYHNQFCRGKWGDSRNYDITVNSAKLGIEETANTLEAYIKKCQERL